MTRIIIIRNAAARRSRALPRQGNLKQGEPKRRDNQKADFQNPSRRNWTGW